MTERGLPTSIELRIVTPEGELVHRPVDEFQAPGTLGYFGVWPGHTPFLAALGFGEISYLAEGVRHYLSCFGGFCEVLPDRVTVLADLGERAEEIEIERAEQAREQAATRLKALTREEGYAEALASHQRHITRIAVARKRRSG